MKVVRLEKRETISMADFFSDRLPPSLKVWVEVGGSCGYEAPRVTVHVIRKKGLIFGKDIIATWQSPDTIELFFPEFFSDFEAIIADYEKCLGRHATLRYWEAS